MNHVNILISSIASVVLLMICGCNGEKPKIKNQKLYSYKLYIDDKIQLNLDSAMAGEKDIDTLQFINDSVAFTQAADKFIWKKLVNDILVNAYKTQPSKTFVQDSGRTFKILNSKGQDLRSLLPTKFTDSVEKAKVKFLAKMRHDDYIEREHKKIHPDGT